MPSHAVPCRYMPSHAGACHRRRIELFLATVPQLLRALPEANFADHRAALVEAKLEAPKTQRDEASLHWAEISAGTCDFGRNVTDAACLRAITQEELVECWERTFAAGAPQRRKLLACAYAAHIPLPAPSSLISAVCDATIVCVDGLDAVSDYKRTLSAYPSPSRADDR